MYLRQFVFTQKESNNYRGII